MSHLVWAGVCLVTMSAAALSQEAPPSAARDLEQVNLLEVTPFDRLILTNGDVVDCEPLAPRPLPRARPTTLVRIRLLYGEHRDYEIARGDIAPR